MRKVKTKTQTCMKTNALIAHTQMHLTHTHDASAHTQTQVQSLVSNSGEDPQTAAGVIPVTVATENTVMQASMMSLNESVVRGNFGGFFLLWCRAKSGTALKMRNSETKGGISP